MVIAIARLELALDGCRSLKDKRQILRSVIERSRARYEVSIAEIEDQDLWQRAVIGAACVSGSVHHASERIDKLVNYIMEAHPECEVLDHQVDILTQY